MPLKFLRYAVRCLPALVLLRLPPGEWASAQVSGNTRSIARAMAAGARYIESASAHIVQDLKPQPGFLMFLQGRAKGKLVTHREYRWWVKGDRWRVDDYSLSAVPLIHIFDGTRLFLYENHGKANYTRGTVLGRATSPAFTPIQMAYGLGGMSAAAALEEKGFHVTGQAVDRRFGKLYEVQGHVDGKGISTVTLWIAPDRGYQIVRREFRNNRMGMVLAVDRTEEMQQAGGIWVPSRFIHEERYPGREATTTIIVTDIRVNDVSDSVFHPRFLKRGMLFADGVPLEIRPGGALALDPRGAAASELRFWSHGPVRFATALLVFTLLGAAVRTSVHLLRRGRVLR
ncbi:MAG: hypothetical protein ACP5VE_15125 [Chthonomonadales bacterium]